MTASDEERGGPVPLGAAGGGGPATAAGDDPGPAGASGSDIAAGAVDTVAGRVPAGPLDLTGKAAVVTGGSRGVGRAIAEALLGAGAEVLICGRHQPPPGELPQAGGRTARFVAADVRVPEEAAGVVEEAARRFGRLDILVNNAGGSPAADAATVSPRFVASVVALNLLAPFSCAQAANAVMQRQPDGGTIINISSVSGSRPSPGTAAYGAAKAGLDNLTRTLAMEWAPKVRVNAVVAGLVATEAAVEHYGGSRGLAAVAATVPAGRLASPADVAGVCLLLASPLAAYVSGAAVRADGGGERPPFLEAARGERGG